MHNINLSVLFLAEMSVGVGIAVAIVTLLLGAAVGFIAYKMTTEKKVGSADERVRKIVSDAEAEAERIKTQGKEESKRALKEALLEAKEQDLKLRN
jgi:hypothetical protein